MRVVLLPALAVAALLAGCAPSTTLLGVDPAGVATVTVRHVLDEKPKERVTLRGEMVEKCPTAGCWFRLRDDTGAVKVDLKGAGLTVADVPAGTRVTVVGVRRVSGGETDFDAVGLRY